MFIPDRDKEGKIVQWSTPFASSYGYFFRGKGVKGTITKNTTGNIDLLVSEERHLNGIQIIVKNQAWDDSAKLIVIDKDNVLGYGENFVLDQFADEWYFSDEVSNNGPILLPYKARIYSGIYLRLQYTSTGTENDVNLKINYFLHKPPAE